MLNLLTRVLKGTAKTLTAKSKCQVVRKTGNGKLRLEKTYSEQIIFSIHLKEYLGAWDSAHCCKE